MEIWNDYTDCEDRKKIKEALDAFNRIIDGLLILADTKYVTGILQSSPAIAREYFNFTQDFNGLEKLSLKFESMRSILFGDNLDWEAISKTLEQEE